MWILKNFKNYYSKRNCPWSPSKSPPPPFWAHLSSWPFSKAVLEVLLFECHYLCWSGCRDVLNQNSKHLPFILTLGKSQKLHGARSGNWGGWEHSVLFWFSRNCCKCLDTGHQGSHRMIVSKEGFEFHFRNWQERGVWRVQNLGCRGGFSGR